MLRKSEDNTCLRGSVETEELPSKTFVIMISSVLKVENVAILVLYVVVRWCCQPFSDW